MLWAFAGQVVARWLAETAKCDPHTTPAGAPERCFGSTMRDSGII
jgi:hypothetical protein